MVYDVNSRKEFADSTLIFLQLPLLINNSLLSEEISNIRGVVVLSIMLRLFLLVKERLSMHMYINFGIMHIFVLCNWKCF